MSNPVSQNVEDPSEEIQRALEGLEDDDILSIPGVVAVPVEEIAEIPAGPLVVKTSHSIYDFGPAEKNGKRAVTRKENATGKEKKLPFSSCKINILEKGISMELTPMGIGFSDPWQTSVIKSITTG